MAEKKGYTKGFELDAMSLVLAQGYTRYKVARTNRMFKAHDDK